MLGDDRRPRPSSVAGTALLLTADPALIRAYHSGQNSAISGTPASTTMTDSGRPSRQ